MKTSNLTGAALDWAVATIVTYQPPYDEYTKVWLSQHRYSTDWAQGGPIIERERILIQPEIGKEGCGNAWNAISMQDTEDYGPTPLIAAMRCYVAYKLGDEVEIPNELTGVNK